MPPTIGAIPPAAASTADSFFSKLPKPHSKKSQIKTQPAERVKQQ
jgi:hypothetical protein